MNSCTIQDYMFIEYDGIPIELIRKPIKNMYLRIYPPDGRVRITAPKGVKDQLIHQYLEDKSNWIKEQQEKMKKVSIPQEDSLTTGVSIPFQGINYLLIIEEHHGPHKIIIRDQILHCYVKPDTSQTKMKSLLNRWYKEEMQAHIPRLLQKWEPIIGVHINQWVIKNMKTRWGSCTPSQGRICLNLNLIKKPLSCLEYVLVHELTHMLEKNHNKRFYTLMSHFLPEWQNIHYILENKKKRVHSNRGIEID